MATRNLPSLDFVLQSLRQENGRLFWLNRPKNHFPDRQSQNAWNARWGGKEAGCVKKYRGGPRRLINFNGKLIYRHVIVWAIHHGEWPTCDLDHKNRDSLDDRIDNLRPATRGQNLANSRLSSRNTSGFKGVYWNKARRKWVASIAANNKSIYLGGFDDPDEAHEVREEAARELHGEFACDGTS